MFAGIFLVKMNKVNIPKHNDNTKMVRGFQISNYFVIVRETNTVLRKEIQFSTGTEGTVVQRLSRTS